MVGQVPLRLLSPRRQPHATFPAILWDSTTGAGSLKTFPRGEIHSTARVSEAAAVADSATVGAFTVVHDGVHLADGVVVGSHCSIGEPIGSWYEDQSPPVGCTVGDDAIIRSHSVIYDGVVVGAGLRTGHRAVIREASVLGFDVQVGSGADLQGSLIIGDHVRIHSNVFVAPGSNIRDYAWLFPGVILTNDPHPPSDSCSQGPDIGEFAAIGAASVVLPGVRVGRHSLVAAASVVAHDVPEMTVVLGTPARVRGPVTDVVCRHGALDQVYPWPVQFRRGYPAGALPPESDFTGRSDSGSS